MGKLLFLRSAAEAPPPPPEPSARVPLSDTALTRKRTVEKLLYEVARGVSLAAAMQAARAADDTLPSASTLRRWVDAYRAEGADALIDGRQGRQRTVWDWEFRAIELWNQATRPNRGTVAWWLQREGFATATRSRVARFLDSLPATEGGEDARGRAGKAAYRLLATAPRRRDRTALAVGEAYQGDGHSSKTVIAHPRTGQPWRPEITAWIDLRTRYLVGWWVSPAESGPSALYSLASALRAHNHVPDVVSTDRGSGFCARLLSDAHAGWLQRIGIEHRPGIPGNPRGRGDIEQWWGTLEERFGKRWATWLGAARTDDVPARLRKKIRDGAVTLPTFDAFLAGLKDFVTAYNHTHQAALGAAPAQIWSQLRRNPVELSDAVLLRPAETRRVRAGEVRLFGRIYASRALEQWNSRDVTVEYDLADDSQVWVLTDTAALAVGLAERIPYAFAPLSTSRNQDREAWRLQNQARRLARRHAEIEGQAGQAIRPAAITADARVVDLLPDPEAEDTQDRVLDILPDE